MAILKFVTYAWIIFVISLFFFGFISSDTTRNPKA
ncbi:MULTISPECIES: photosystem II reaction center protein I [Acaryochloris]|uniref:Photosystem II protein PsbI n=1 Tax=Acaryochloris marina (strain MBIC 11017) TaxID=329726 RepID=B0C5R5_ACAM1|nr:MULTISPECIES: photosystem II reaction center protein I [Acaryochloris]7YMI_I Chain I, Photosystem II protein PsbI [Acaryochloris marina MBIC11017]7YMI_i Chain i, Photosystem II protein PsbI [Acaryochloris marina MBIC11017]7YMM_1I Chain 1I, Photosystem II protein PsbI [Acaryochloris marina MBIC11017]7YMM_2I Chain 2I, Photosystem II protein PsbI [Acaryochloris marina MBIC11017]7YMM_3I Chain 3I, Photosystem II protein PsbI [Acaryochloris marina MBIC11017]7YMM_4I Chain 4I, Photosystem II prote